MHRSPCCWKIKIFYPNLLASSIFIVGICEPSFRTLFTTSGRSKAKNHVQIKLPNLNTVFRKHLLCTTVPTGLAKDPKDQPSILTILHSPLCRSRTSMFKVPISGVQLSETFNWQNMQKTKTALPEVTQQSDNRVGKLLIQLYNTTLKSLGLGNSLTVLGYQTRNPPSVNNNLLWPRLNGLIFLAYIISC